MQAKEGRTSWMALRVGTKHKRGTCLCDAAGLVRRLVYQRHAGLRRPLVRVKLCMTRMCVCVQSTVGDSRVR